MLERVLRSGNTATPEKEGVGVVIVYCCCWMVSLSYTRPRPPVVRNNRETWLFLETAWLSTDCVCPSAKEEDKTGGKEQGKRDRLLGVL